MKKLTKKFLLALSSAILVASALTLASCKKDDDDDDASVSIPTAVAPKATTGNVSQATTVGGTTKATLAASDGEYVFTQENSASSYIAARTVDETKNGTWTFTETGKTIAKYKGSYKGDISKFSNDLVELTLTVEKAQNSNGGLVAVKTTVSFTFAATTTTFTAVIPAVTLESSSPITLPDSVGANALEGTTWSFKEYEDFVTTLAFTDDTITLTEAQEDSKSTTKFSYTYDAEKGLVYAALLENKEQEEDSYEFSFTSLEEAIALLKAFTSGAELEAGIEEMKLMYGTTFIAKYEISGNTLTWTSYFDGSLPTYSQLYSSDNHGMYFEKTKFAIGSTSTAEKQTKYFCYPTFTKTGEGNTFEFKDIQLYYVATYENDEESEDRTIAKAGTISGTCATTSGDGEGTIEVTFTSLPADLPSDLGLKTGTAYTLSVSQESEEFTKVSN